MRPDLESLVNEVADELASALRHYGPGAHPGTGTEQQAHAGDGARPQRHPEVDGQFNRYMEANRRSEGEPLGPRDLAVAIRQARLTPGTDEWRERRDKWEAELATLGEARVQDGTWIGPSGKILGPGADHQQTALALLRWDLHALGGEAPGIATDLAVLGGLIRYNVDHYSIYFDIPSLDQTTDEQWAAMAGLVGTRTRDEKVVPGLTISVGGAFRPTTYYDGADAYDQLDLDPQDLADQFDAWLGQGVLRRLHYGPGDHPGTGTPQQAHAGADGRESKVIAGERQKGGQFPSNTNINAAAKARRYLAERIDHHLGRPVTIGRGMVDEFYDHVRQKAPSGLWVKDDEGHGLLVVAADGGAYGWEPRVMALGGLFAFEPGTPVYQRTEEGHPIAMEGAGGKGSGLGTAFMQALKDYVDASDKKLIVHTVANPRFFERFDWLRREDPESTLSYRYQSVGYTLSTGSQ